MKGMWNLIERIVYMMRKSMFLASFVAAMSLYAGDGVTRTINFSSTGPDCYADGTQVLDGEVYALVYASGEFDGLKADGTLVDSNDKIVCKAPLAKNGRCPFITFILDGDNADLSESNLSVYLLDTRKTVKNGDAVVVSVGPQSGSYDGVVYNGYVKVDATISSSRNATAGVTSLAGGVVTALPDGVENPSIADFRMLDDGQAILEVANTSPYVNYTVSGGKTPAANEKVIATGLNGVGGEDSLFLTTTMDEDDAAKFRFFKVVRTGEGN